MSKSYPSNLTRAQYEFLLISPPSQVKPRYKVGERRSWASSFRAAALAEQRFAIARNPNTPLNLLKSLVSDRAVVNLAQAKLKERFR